MHYKNAHPVGVCGGLFVIAAKGEEGKKLVLTNNGEWSPVKGYTMANVSSVRNLATFSSAKEAKRLIGQMHRNLAQGNVIDNPCRRRISLSRLQRKYSRVR